MIAPVKINFIKYVEADDPVRQKQRSENKVIELEENKHKISYIKAKLKSIGDSL
jgi:hypothetical protein